MNTASLARIAVAKQIAPHYRHLPNVAAILVSGSTGRGDADRFSDLEMSILWHQPPSDAEREAVRDALTPSWSRLHPYNAAEGIWSDDFQLAPDAAGNPLLVEVVHSTLDSVSAGLDRLLNEGDPSEGLQVMASGLLDGTPLYGETHFAPLQARARHYPDALAVAVIGKHGQIDHFWRWQMYLARGENYLGLYQHFTAIQVKVLHMLLAVNRVYFFGAKWLEQLAARLVYAPPHLLERLRAQLCGNPSDAAADLAHMVEETYTLVAAHIPQVDVAWLRRIFAYQRPNWLNEVSAS